MKDTIEQLIKLVDKNKLSVVVGAGFSKNASPKYLSWKELLKDMILEMYGSRVRNTAEYAKIRGSDNEQLLWNCFVDQIIAEKGYLNIASEYIKRYGYREIIDNYIEARTPLVIKDQDKYFAKLNDEKHEVDLTTHEYLLDVQWNNVYTFNYDNLLDIAGGADRNEELEAEKNNLNSRITQIDSRLRDINKELENIKIAEEPNQLEFKDVFNEKESLVSSSADPEKLESINKQQKSLVEERGKLLEEKGICKRTIESFEKEQNGLYHLVRNSFDLSLQKQRNLIKLHGTIRTPENDTYGFDNDSHCHYIIASHDYEQYKEKHEAFVNLMRIALLQDSFCLIGFSGDDPNFLSWLSWVKDILDRRGAENNEEKIFFIDVSGVPLSEGKKLFFKNHYIKHVPLFNTPNEATTNNIKQELKQLFKKLNREGRAIKAVLQYTKFWRDYKLNPPKNDNGYLYGIKRQLISEVWDNRKFNRLPKIKLDFTGFKQRVIREIVRQADKGKFDEDTSKLFILALYGDFLPLDAHIDNGKLELLRDMFNSDTEIGKEFELLYIRNLNLTAQDLSEYTSNNTTDAIIYESLLSAAFHLDFDSMYQQLNQWSPEELSWKSRVIALNSYFNLKNDASINDIEKSSETNIQEYRYYLDTILNASFGVEWFYKTDIFYLNYNGKREGINKELNRLDENTQYLIEKLSKQKVEITPRGNTNITYHFGGQMALEYSIQYLQVINEIGLPLCKFRINFLKKEEWYLVFKNIYTLYPYPCLFYSLQFGTEENFMRRVAEDYVYSNELSDIHTDILSYCLKAYSMEHTPQNIKMGILSFTPLFFKVVHSKLWKEDFGKIVKTFELKKRDINREIGNPENYFLRAGLLHTSSQPLKLNITNKILSLGNKIDEVDNRILIAALSNLSKSYKRQVKSKYIDQLIESAEQVSQYFVLFNLKDLLSQEQVDKVALRLLGFDFKNCHEENMFEASSRIAKEYSSLSNSIEDVIIESKLLWHNGINFDENRRPFITHGGGFLKITRLQENLNFVDSTINKLFTKLKKSFADIVNVIKSSNEKEPVPPFMEPYWSKLLLEMQLFLRTNQSILQFRKDYDKISQLVEKAYYQLNKTNSIMDGLMSNDDYKVRESIQKLVYEVDSFGIEKYTSEYLVIVNRIASKTNPGLNSCINNFVSVIKAYKSDIDSKLFIPFIKQILEEYTKYFNISDAIWDINAKKEDVEDAMLQLNNEAIEWGVENKYWSSHKRVF